MPRKMPAVKSNKFNKNIAALEEHSQQQQKDYRQKQQQLSDASRSERAKREDAGNSGESSRKANVSLLQPIQIISSDDDATTDAAHSSFSDGHGFAGFASPSSNLANVTPVTSCRSLRQRHAAVIKENSSGCLAMPKRSSLGSRKSAECISPPEYEKLLPAKRRKDQCQMGAENAEGLHLPPNMQTPPPDQVVEVSSNSSTHSQQQQQRVLRRSTLQQQTNIPQKLITKASTETSSEFPVSSPSNPQPGGSKFPQRPPLLKNTLPADSFERQLALVAARNPQMTLADKMQAWQCETELSDVEDVNEFDARFQTAEEKKRKTSKCQKSPESLEDDYDFQHFRYVVLNNLRSQMNLAQQKEDEWDKPSTSAAAAAHARRQEVKKSRPLKESTQQKKKTQSSTTPAPASSSASISASSHGSSEYLAAVGNTSPGRKKNPTNTNLAPKLQIHEVLCPSSSTDASMHVACVSHKPSATTTVPTSTVTTSTAKNKEAGTGQLAPNKFNSKELIADAAKNVAPLSPKPLNIQCSSTEEDSVFRLNRLNREIDKTKLELPLSNRAEPKRLIQMHLDFLAEKEKLNLREKKFELFKTPVVPARYSPTSQNCCQQQTSSDNQVNNNNNNNNCNSKSNSIININCKTNSNNIKININKCSNATHSSASKNNKEIDIHDSNYPSFMSPCDSCDSYDFTRSAKDMVKLAMHATAKAKQHDRMRQKHEDVVQQQQDGLRQQQNVLQQHCLQQQPEGMHQQHEFCNYLGLTGMSTANAVANAVAELAKSNIARRSLRVRRQQHTQDKQEKNNREQKILEALKIKQLREIKRRDKPMKSSLDELNEQIAKVEAGESLIDTKSDEEDIANKNQLLNNIQTLAQAMPLPAVNNVKETVKKEPEIKIICHIAADADDHEEVEKVSKKYVKKLTDPIRNTLIREINEGNALIGVDASLQSQTEEAARCELGKLQLETLNEIIKKEVAENETLPPPNDEDSSDSLPSDKKSVIEIGTQEHKQQFCQHQQLDQQYSERSSNKVVAEAKIEDLLMANTQEKLHMKFQEYLEASRRAKPSIYIVQSIDNDRDIKKKYVLTEVVKAGDAGAASAGTGGTNSVEAAKATPAKGKEFCSLQNVPIDSRLSAGAIDIKRKNRKHLSKLLTRSVLNMTQQRQLRNRKIVILKTIKRKSLKSRSKEKKLKKSKQSLQNKESMGNCIKVALEETQKKSSVTARRRHTAVITKYSNGNIESNYDAEAGHVTILYEQNTQMKDSAMDMKPVENDLVVVSSTTNCYDEQGTKERGGRKTPESVASRRTFVLDDNIIYTKESGMQCSPTPITGLSQLTPPSSPMRNPLKAAQGKVLYIYYELDVLIVVQETLISFWKYSKLLLVLNMLANKSSAAPPQQQAKHSNNQLRQQEQREVETSSTLPTSSPPLDADAGSGGESGFEWLHLGECKRLQYDYEISTPYANRICIHNSMPIYIEMRCKELQKERRDCNLCSLYINIYFYNDEEMLAKMHSIQLDAVQCVPQNVIYTTITDSRYFVMSWPQENIMGKVRSGLCKYSLTPHLDTLASIREFKSMRNEIRYLECSDDDKLLGFGATQLTIWDHRSGDVLMNYDLGLSLGRNLGSIYYPSLEIGQNSMILLFQLLPYMKESEESEENKEQTDATAKCIEEQHAEVHVMVCNISHLAPSHRVLYRHVLPSPAFTKLFSAINTGDHLLLTAPNDEEIWISCNDPKMMTLLPAQNSQRFYARGRSQLIELTEHSLSVDCIANHVLKISTATI